MKIYIHRYVEGKQEVKHLTETISISRMWDGIEKSHEDSIHESPTCIWEGEIEMTKPAFW